MPGLREMQRDFLGAILSGEAGPVAGQVRDDGVPAPQRLQIYRNNARANFLATLSATYPVIERLGGADWFAQAVGRYQHLYPSRCGDLQYAGERFPAFLRLELQGTPHGYFSDVARLEWAYQEVLTAADSPVLDLARLAAVAPDAYERLLFEMHPALRTVASALPVLAIWRANQPGVPDDGSPVDLDDGPGRVLLTRQADHVELRDCPPGLFALVQTLAAARPLGVAAALAAQVDPGFDLTAGLRRLAGLGVLSDFRLAAATDMTPEEP